MLNFRTVYEPWIKLCKELIEEKKELQEKLERTEFYLRLAERRNEKLKEMVEKLQDEKRRDLEKRVADLEQGKQLFLLDDNSTPIKSFTLTGKLTLMDETTEEKLEVGKWYHTDDFTVEKLKELLPVGTTVLVEKDVAYENIETKSPIVTLKRKVVGVTTRNWPEKPLINVNEITNKEWFKIVEEEK